MNGISTSKRPALRRIVLITLLIPLSACIQTRLKQLEIRQLQTELAGIQQTREYLATTPTLARDYDADLSVSQDTFNRFLAGLSNYTVKLPKPEGAKLVVEQAQLRFQDGPPEAVIAAQAVNRRGDIAVRLRIRADLIMVEDPANSSVKFKYLIREVVPDVKLSIFRIRQLFFVGRLLRLKGQEYLDSLPETQIPLSADLPIVMDPDDRTELKLSNNASILAYQKLPHFSLEYRYRLLRVLTLADGVHLFFKMERVR